MTGSVLHTLAQEGGFFPGGFLWASILFLLWLLSMVLAPGLGAYRGTVGVTDAARRAAWIGLGTAGGCMLSIGFLGLVLYGFDLPKSRSEVGLIIAAASPLVGWLLGSGITWLLRRENGQKSHDGRRATWMLKRE